MDQPASIVIPTRARLAYLEVALASIAPQAAAAGAEVLVVDDAGPTAAARSLVERFGARYTPHDRPTGLNAARNTGVTHSRGELVVFVDDDVRARPGWLQALIEAARSEPDEEVFAGRILARLEGHAPRTCGREQPPITHLDLGEQDARTPFAWGTNMAIRRAALDRVGPFDVTLAEGGDEQDWQERRDRDRQADAPAGARYVAAATVEHRRQGTDTGLGSLCSAAAARGRAARRFDVRRGRAPGVGRELATLAGCLGHVLLRRCPAGLTMAAHSGGRLAEALRGDAAGARSAAFAASSERGGRDGGRDGGEDFLSGASGTVGGLDGVRRRLQDRGVAAGDVLGGRRRRLSQAARSSPPTRRVLALGVVRPELRATASVMAAELARSRHTVELRTSEPGEEGKFENLNRLLQEHPAEGHDWLLLLDDDVELPRGFLDGLLFLAERFSLELAQPAHVLDSHAAWAVTRRHSRSVVRETAFVEIGPVTLFASETFPALLPFPDLRMGWGLDLHWAAVAREHGWRCGVIDALPIRHRLAPAASSYGREQAIAEAGAFLAERPHLSAPEAERTLITHRSW